MPYARTVSSHRTLSLLALFLLCSACASTKVKEAETPPARAREIKENKETKPAPKVITPAPATLEKAQQELDSGISSYENGAYKQAARQVQSALALGLETRSDKARAHKYLAFMLCVDGKQRPCRDEFRKALDADPAFDLSPAEAGHPTWGPVFRKLKATRKSAAK